MLLLLWLAFFIYFHVNDLYFISNISNKKKNINLATAKNSVFSTKNRFVETERTEKEADYSATDSATRFQHVFDMHGIR